MNHNTKMVVDCLNKITDLLGAKTIEECEAIFVSKVSLSNLKECYLDPDIDQDDCEAIKEAMSFFYGYQMESN